MTLAGDAMVARRSRALRRARAARAARDARPVAAARCPRASCRRRRASPRRCSRWARRSRRRRVDVLPLSRGGRGAAEGRHVPEAGCRDDRAAEARPGVRPHRARTTCSRSSATLGIRTAVVDRGSLPACSRPFGRSARAASVPDRGERSSATSMPRLDRVKASVAGRPPRKILIIVGRRTGTLTDIIAVGPGSYLHDIADDRRRRERAGVGAAGVSADLDGDGHQPGARRHRRRRRDGRIAGGLRAPAADHRRLCGGVRRWSRRCATGGVHAVHDEAFVVPGPRIVDVAESDGAMAPRSASRDDDRRCSAVRNVGWRAATVPRAGARLLRRRAGRVRGGHGPQRRRQEHAARYRRRPAHADRRRRDRWPIGRSTSWTADRTGADARAPAAEPPRRSVDARRGAGADGPLCARGPLVRVGRGPPDRAKRRCSGATAWSSGAERWRRSAAASGSACSSPPVSRSRPRLLLLDEPATFLDVDQQLQCFNVLRAEADRGARVRGGHARREPRA